MIKSINSANMAEASQVERLNRFAADLEIVQSNCLRPLPDFSEGLNHSGKIPTDTSRYKRLEGVYLHADVQTAWGGQRCIPDSICFQPKPFRGLGRDASRQGVFFGDMTIVIDGEPTDLAVAVKPFKPSSFHHATQEAGILEHLKHEGIPTLQVLGMIALPDAAAPRTYMVTQEQPGLMTLDNTAWESLPEIERWHRIRPAVDTAVTLHGHGIFHGDFRFRNLPQREADRKVMIVDTEFSVSLRDVLTPYTDLPEERVILAQNMGAEFAALETSIADHIVPDLGPSDRFEAMVEHVYARYQNGLMHTESPYRSVLLSAADMVLNNKRKQAYSG